MKKKQLTIQNRILFGLVGVLSLVAIAGVARADSGDFLEQVRREVIAQVVEILVGTGIAPSLGGSYTSEPGHLTASDDWQGTNSLYEYGDLEVNGESWFDGALYASSTFGTSGTTTLSYTPNQLNTASIIMNPASTTLCSVQNTSGVRRVITGLSILSTGSSGAGALTQVRAYIGGNRADMHDVATATLFKQALVDVTVSGVQVFGGPVPMSYYLSSTAFGTGISSIPTTTLAIWDPGSYVNVTSSAITSSTGNCSIWNYQL